MDSPTPRARIRDPKTNVTYVVCAYREITTDEAKQAVLHHMAQQKKKPKRGSTVIVLTIHGFDQ